MKYFTIHPQPVLPYEERQDFARSTAHVFELHFPHDDVSITPLESSPGLAVQCDHGAADHEIRKLLAALWEAYILTQPAI